MIAFYISGHGFGHASRDIEVINAILDRRPDVPIVIRTPAARWLFDLTLRHPVGFQPEETDTGIVQIDSLHLDARASIARAAAFYAELDARALREAEWLRDAGAALVVGDIPPLAFSAAARARVPAIALGNFTWDWIYAGYTELLGDAPSLVPTISAAYETAAFAIRLPMHGGFASMATIQDVPFVARHSRRHPLEARAALQLGDDERLVLLSFGGHGLKGLDLARVDAAGDYTLITTGALPPAARTMDAGDLRSAVMRHDHVVEIDERRLYNLGLRYEDLVAASDVVVTKPGYGIIAECLAHDRPLLYTSRGHFVEYDVLVADMPRFLRSRFISQDDLYGGKWRSHLDALLAQPDAPERPPTNGAEIAADLILACAAKRLPISYDA